MAYTLAQNPAVANGTGASISKAFGSNVTAHSLLIALVTTDAATPGTFTFTGGGTWVSIGSVLNTNDSQWVTIGYCLDATGGSAPTIQASWTGNGAFNGINIAEFTNGGVASLFDTSTPGRLITNVAITDIAVVASVNGLVVSHTNIGGGSVTSAGGGFTLWTNSDPNLDWGEYQVVAGGGSVTPTFNQGSANTAAIISAAFKPAGSATATAISPAYPGKTWLRKFRHRQNLLQTQPGPPISIALSDTVASADAITVTATVPLTDVVAATDNITVTVTVSLSDTIATNDALSVAAAVPLADTSSVTDALSTAAAVPLTDTVLSTDALTVAAAVALSDLVHAADAISIAAAVPLTDSVSIVDVLNVATGTNPSLTDVVSVSDNLSIVVTLALSDTVSIDDFLDSGHPLNTVMTIYVLGPDAPFVTTLTHERPLQHFITKRAWDSLNINSIPKNVIVGTIYDVYVNTLQPPNTYFLGTLKVVE